MIKKMLRRTVFLIGSTGLIVLASACVSTPHTTNSGAVPPPGQGLDEFVLVDCLLPGQIRQLGTRMTYLAPRRQTKTTKRDCAIRGGEFVLFDRSDYSAALASLLPKARSGDPVAQMYVGEIYEKGLGLPVSDYNSAASWYRKAADQNHAPAQTSLGSLYERGLGVPQDKAQALNWYRKATGITDDNLVFESQLKAERERFRRELSLRNKTARSLQQRLRQSKQKLERQPSEIASSPDSAGDDKKRVVQQSERIALQVGHDKEQSLLESQQRDAESEMERRKKELDAIRALKASTLREQGSPSAKVKAAQLGKLELTRNEQYRAIVDVTRQLAGSP